jgi:hypothetical protein
MRRSAVVVEKQVIVVEAGRRRLARICGGHYGGILFSSSFAVRHSLVI